MGGLQKVLANLHDRGKKNLEITVPKSRKKGLSCKCANYTCGNYPRTYARTKTLSKSNSEGEQDLRGSLHWRKLAEQRRQDADLVRHESGGHSRTYKQNRALRAK